jgi:tRNA uridine 5-carbamoylmethylation protein Kti12
VALVLLGGSPGIGKSTLTNMALGHLAAAGRSTPASASGTAASASAPLEMSISTSCADRSLARNQATA